MIHLDTSFLIRSLVPGSETDRRLRAWLREGEPLGMSAIAWAEFLCGPLAETQLQLVNLIVPRRAPFGEDEAILASRLFNDSGRRRGSLADCMIAATAIREEATLATRNPRDFRRFESAGLHVVD
jgi:predicted nucleic acid-binding protein